jgi:hypothetical protein
MDYALNYGQVYDVKIKDEEYKGIYIGERAPKVRLKSGWSILINKPSSLLWGFSLVGFNGYTFDKDMKLIINIPYYINPSSKEKGNLEELFKNQITKLL